MLSMNAASRKLSASFPWTRFYLLRNQIAAVPLILHSPARQSTSSAAQSIRRKKPPRTTRFGLLPAASINDSNSTSIDIVDDDPLRRSSKIQHDVQTGHLFVARDKFGHEITMEKYLKEVATLSPWVPCPDAVIRKCLDIARVSSSDVHYDLGSGDGRVCFHAIDSPYFVHKSVGIDTDASMIQKSNQRIMKRHPYPKNIEFICTDLLNLEGEENTRKVWEQLKAECTILTMFFVEDGLQKLKPILEKYLEGSSCKVITIAYPMKGWEPSWVEVILDLRVHLYEMGNHKNHHTGDGESMEYSLNNVTQGTQELQRDSQNILTRATRVEGNVAQIISDDPFLPQEEKGPPLQILEYDANEDIDFHWDNFDPISDDDLTKERKVQP